MMDDIEDVYDAVRWLREHGVEINNNTEGESNYGKKIKVISKVDKSKGYRQHKNVV